MSDKRAREYEERPCSGAELENQIQSALDENDRRKALRLIQEQSAMTVSHPNSSTPEVTVKLEVDIDVSSENLVTACDVGARPGKKRKRENGKKAKAKKTSSYADIPEETRQTLEQLIGSAPKLDKVETETRPECGCAVKDTKKDVFFSHLGHARNVCDLQKTFAGQLGMKPAQIRVVLIERTSVEGKTPNGCTDYRKTDVVSQEGERVLVLGHLRPKHTCEFRICVSLVVIHNCLPENKLAEHYVALKDVSKYKNSLKRTCAKGKSPCDCQGDPPVGSTVSLGCTHQKAYRGCKHARSLSVNKFDLKPDAKGHEKGLENTLVDIHDTTVPTFRKALPLAYRNMTSHSQIAESCRIGGLTPAERPFAAVSVASSFSAHPHTDSNDLPTGVVMLLTLLSPSARQNEIVPQLHVLTEFALVDSADRDKKRGGVAVALRHGSLLLEPARHLRHATTKAVDSGGEGPSRLAVIFFQHEQLRNPDHGRLQYLAYMSWYLRITYQAWKQGWFIMTSRRLLNFKSAGFRFADSVTVYPAGTELSDCGDPTPIPSDQLYEENEHIVPYLNDLTFADDAEEQPQELVGETSVETVNRTKVLVSCAFKCIKSTRRAVLLHFAMYHLPHCPLCTLTGIDSIGMKDHFNDEHQGDDWKNCDFECSYCPLKLKVPTEYLAHMRGCHRKELYHDKRDKDSKKFDRARLLN